MGGINIAVRHHKERKFIMHKTILTAFICSIMVTIAYAEPSINSTTGTWAHSSTVTITGNDFGSKTTEVPIIWDDFETGSFSTKWRAKLPSASKGATDDYIMNVRAHNWRNISASHSRSQYHAAGGHDPAGYQAVSGRNFNRSGPNVMISFDVSPPIGPNTGLYLRYYYRHDPLWDGPFHNLKLSDVSNWDGAESNMWPHNQGGHDYYFEYRALPLSGRIGMHTVHSNMRSCSGYNYPCDAGMHPPEPNQGWNLYEYLIMHNSTNGFCRVYIDNKLVYEKGTGEDCNEFSYDINSLWLGGYFRATLNPESGDPDGYRYFDDVYADRAFQRVVLTNNSNYRFSTIIEPQIPSAWNSDGNSITCTVNLGKLPDSGTAYLFVFDADNKHNPVGFAFEIGGS